MHTRDLNDESGWPQIKGEVKKIWARLSDEELDNTHGGFQEISSLIENKYGDAQDSFRQRLADVFKKYGDEKDGSWGSEIRM